MKILQYSSNPFGGVILSSSDIPLSSDDFLDTMKFSIEEWEKVNNEIAVDAEVVKLIFS